MKLNNRGQALIEFVLILPVILMILFAIVDIGSIYTNKLKLENNTYDIVNLISNGKDIDEIRDIYGNLSINVSLQDKYKVVTVQDSVRLVTPLAYRVIGNPFKIEVKRYIYYET